MKLSEYPRVQHTQVASGITWKHARTGVKCITVTLCYWTTEEFSWDGLDLTEVYHLHMN